MGKLLRLIFIVAVLVCWNSRAQEPATSKFEKDIVKFEERDKENPPPKGAILFVGSSTFTKWRSVGEDLKPLPVINRGFGGSSMPELLKVVDRIVIPYAPKIIVVYEGDNDLAGKDSKAEKFFENCKVFIEKVQKALPDTKIIFLTVKPSIKRWDRWEEMKKANQMVADHVKQGSGLGQIDISPAILGQDGKPDKELFEKDDLHLNSKGYAKLVEIIKPILAKEYATSK